MYGLPKDFDASVFVGRELTEVCFSANTVHFVFGDKLSVTIEGSFVVRSDGCDEKQEVPVKATRVMGLIGNTVKEAEGRDDGTLFLRFDGERALECLDDSSEYESYKVRIGDAEIVV